jgi:hypothetical protein
MVSDEAARRARWILGSMAGAALIAGAVRLRARHSSGAADQVVDVEQRLAGSRVQERTV